MDDVRVCERDGFDISWPDLRERRLLVVNDEASCSPVERIRRKLAMDDRLHIFSIMSSSGACC